MKYSQIEKWEKALDAAEANPLLANLPTTAPLGMIFADKSEDGILRKWLRVKVVSGSPGARWAYWSNRDEHESIADRLFNGDASHFIGMLGAPHRGNPYPEDAWVLIDPKVEYREQWTYEQREGPRYERSKEEYDVETGKVRKI